MSCAPRFDAWRSEGRLDSDMFEYAALPLRLLAVRPFLVGLIVSLPVMAAAQPTVERAFESAALAPCLAAAPHPDDPLRVTLVTYADGAWAVAPASFEDAPPEALQRCLSEAVRDALAAVPRPGRELVLERTLWPSTSLEQRFEQARAEIVDCVLLRQPKVDRLVARLRLSTNAKGALTVETTAGRELVGCLKQHLVSLRPSDTANVELEVERPGAPPRHDGTAGAVCEWANRNARLPRPRACRAGLVCSECSGGAQQLEPEPVDRICVDSVVGCPPVP